MAMVVGLAEQLTTGGCGCFTVNDALQLATLFFFSFSSVAVAVHRVAARRQSGGIDISSRTRAGNLATGAAPLVGQRVLGVEISEC